MTTSDVTSSETPLRHQRKLRNYLLDAGLHQPVSFHDPSCDLSGTGRIFPQAFLFGRKSAGRAEGNSITMLGRSRRRTSPRVRGRRPSPVQITRSARRI